MAWLRYVYGGIVGMLEYDDGVMDDEVMDESWYEYCRYVLIEMFQLLNW